MAVDFFGSEISVGDECVFIEPNYSELNSGFVNDNLIQQG